MTWLLGILALIASWLPVPDLFDIEYRFYERGPQVVALQEELGTLRMLLGVTDGRTEVLSTN